MEKQEGILGEHQWRCSGMTRGRSRRRPGALGRTCPSVACTMLRYGRCTTTRSMAHRAGLPQRSDVAAGAQRRKARHARRRPHFVVCKRSSGSGGAASTARTAASQPPLRPVFPPPMPGQQDQSRVMQAVVCARIDLAAVARCWFQCRSGQRLRWPSELAKRDRRPRLSRRRVPGLPGRFKVRAAASLTAAEPGQRGQQCRGGMHAASRAARTAAWLPARAVAELHLLQVGRAACCVADRPPEE